MSRLIKGQREGSLICAGIDSLAARGFIGDDAVSRHFYGAPLQEAANGAIETYLLKGRHPRGRLESCYLVA